ncbi:hypothetical protein LAZ67_6002893 [Cordylochernes scorpioides]|uniref:Transposase n=1 Tax=Cordylochernes scorpioides TaxID=51811 RepID=A0ABY6KN28_9ARAC|nr:hypothetical protein LAZ67_6002893 [Cordylochernes scorpioides]
MSFLLSDKNAVKQDGGMARKDFIKQLALQLMRDALNMRNQAKNLSRDLQVLIQKHAGTSSLEALLDEDSSQTQEELAETLGMTQQAISNHIKVMGMVQKQGNWVPYELKPGNIERRICTCELLLKRQNRKGFFASNRDGGRKWIHYDNPKRRKSWGKPGHASTSTAKPNIHGKNLMLCIWWDQLGHDNTWPHVAKVVKETLEALQWDVLPHPPYSPDIAPSDYHMFRSMTHGLAEQHFTSYEEAKNWVDVWIASKDKFFRHGLRMLPERWEKVVAKDGKYFE